MDLHPISDDGKNMAVALRVCTKAVAHLTKKTGKCRKQWLQCGKVKSGMHWVEGA